jgi:uncharacterized membrane protein
VPDSERRNCIETIYSTWNFGFASAAKVALKDRCTASEGSKQMAHIEGQIDINRPVDEVFDFAADQRNEPRYNPAMINSVKLTEGEVGAGTQFLAEFQSRGRVTPMIIECTEFDRPHRVSTMVRMSAMDVQGSLTFEPITQKSTKMRWSWEVQPRGFFKLLGPLVGRMGRRQEQAIWSGLKEHMESEERP